MRIGLLPVLLVVCGCSIQPKMQEVGGLSVAMTLPDGWRVELDRERDRLTASVGPTADPSTYFSAEFCGYRYECGSPIPCRREEIVRGFFSMLDDSKHGINYREGTRPESLRLSRRHPGLSQAAIGNRLAA